ncbi:DNA mismatch repair protein Mlh3 isoform 2-T2 [Pholidichthys leucotaenia]
MIKCLPVEIQGKLRSGVSIPSLQQCVEELVLNSIDAGATCVGVRMDVEALRLQVIDNGDGMSAEDLACVGTRYHTSKCNSVQDLDSLRWYGFRGEALASIVSMATLVEVSSRTRSSVKTHVKIFKDGKGLDVFEAETTRPSAGTTVIICNFFHNMPVRRKRVDALLEGERIRHRVEAVSLMHPSVSFTLRNDCTGAMMVQLPKARNTYHRFVQIYSLGRAEKLGEISYTHEQLKVVGYIGREGHYNNSLQFLYVNDRLLLKTRIHKLLNFLLRRLSSSNQKHESPEGQPITRSPKHKRNQELYGVFILNISCPYSEYDICLEPAKTLIEFKDWDSILLCVEEAVKAFLCRENLVSVVSQDDIDYASPNVHGMADQKETSEKDCRAAITTSMLDSNIGIKLASEAVHRKCTDDCISKEDASVAFGLIECKTNEKEAQEHRDITTNELKKTNNEKYASKKCGEMTPSDETASREKWEPTFNEAGEGSSILHVSNESLVHSEEKAVLGNGLAQQAQPNLNFTEQRMLNSEPIAEQGQTLGSNKKIRLSDPYIHECLTQNLSHSSRVVFDDLMAKYEDRAFVSKRKISLDATLDRSSQAQYKDTLSAIPTKTPRITSCQKSSLSYKDSGSLDIFRRACVKSGQVKLQYCQADLKNSIPQTDCLIFNPKSVSVCQKSLKEGDVKHMQNKEEPQSSSHCPTSLSEFTKLKPISLQNRTKKSLAAKLCLLKQHRGEDSLHEFRTTSEVNNHLSRESDEKMYENPSDSALNLEPDSACSSDLHLADDENTRQSDWFQHYDTSMGKMVYVNRVTGLSRYEDPAAEDTQVACTSDITNMAVSVISETDDGESSNSLSSLYSKWNNPVFVRPPMVGVDISSRQAEGLTVKIHNILFPYRFSKSMIHSMRVIHQVDKKFLACLINTKEEEPVAQTDTEGNLLVLVDQHAAHERVRLENLVKDSYEDDPDASGEKRLCSSNILPPLEISVTEEELRLLRSCQPHLRSLGLEVSFSQRADLRVFVGKVPLCFMEKESNELRRGRPSVIKAVVETSSSSVTSDAQQHPHPACVS